MNDKQTELEAILALRHARDALAPGTRAHEEAEQRLRDAESEYYRRAA